MYSDGIVGTLELLLTVLTKAYFGVVVLLDFVKQNPSLHCGCGVRGGPNVDTAEKNCGIETNCKVVRIYYRFNRC